MARRRRDRRPAHRDRTPLRRVWDRLRAADPGWDRAHTSLRAVVAAAVGAAATAAVFAAVDVRLGLAPLAAVVGIFGGITLPAPAERRRHLRWVAAASTASAVATAALSPSPVAARAGLVAAIAVGAWCGRWGDAGRSVGFLVFLGAFFTLLLGAGPDEVGAVATAMVLGAGGLGVTERWLLPDRPAALLRRLVRSLTSRASLLVDAAATLAAEGPGEGRQRRLRRQLLAVQEAALLVDTTLDAPAARASVAAPDQLRSDVLVAEALADHLVWAVLSIPVDTDLPDRAELVAAMGSARVPMDVDVDRAVAPLVPRLVGPGEDRVVEVLERLAAAVERLVHAARPAPGGHAGTPPPRSAPPHDPGTGPSPVGRTVVQATLSGGLALVLGVALDDAQWYWAVIGAYIVVTTTSTRGAGLRKAADRVLGTALGVVAGLGITAVLADRVGVALLVLLAGLFATFWVLRLNYRLMMLLLTVTIAVLYQVTGVLTVRVLAVRLAETALGALVAAVVVYFVLPAPTRRAVDQAVDGLLAALDDLLAAVPADGVDTAAVRQVDVAISALRAVTAPLVTQAPTRIGDEVRAARLLATAVRVRVGALATALAQQHPRPVSDDDRRALAVLHDHVERLRRHLAAPGSAAPEEPRAFPAPDGAVGAVLQAIDDRLTGYGTARGLALRPDPGALAGGTASPTD